LKEKHRDGVVMQVGCCWDAEEVVSRRLPALVEAVERSSHSVHDESVV